MKLSSKQQILLGAIGMGVAMIGDYLLGVNTIGTTSDPDAYMGIAWNVVPDWRYAWSSVCGFIAAALFAMGAVELFRVMESRFSLGESRLYKLFRVANWTGILYFAFVHIGLCMLPVVFNAGMDITGDIPTAAAMAVRVAKSIAVPLAVTFLLADFGVTVAWIGMLAKGMLPVKKIAMVCNPVVMAVVGNLLNLLPLPFEGIDSGFESLGWLLLYAVCAVRLTRE